MKHIHRVGFVFARKAVPWWAKVMIETVRKAGLACAFFYSNLPTPVERDPLLKFYRFFDGLAHRREAEVFSETPLEDLGGLDPVISLDSEVQSAYTKNVDLFVFPDAAVFRPELADQAPFGALCFDFHSGAAGPGEICMTAWKGAGEGRPRLGLRWFKPGEAHSLLVYESHSHWAYASLYKNASMVYAKTAGAVERSIARIEAEGLNAFADAQQLPRTLEPPVNEGVNAFKTLFRYGRRVALDTLREAFFRRQWVLAYKHYADEREFFDPKGWVPLYPKCRVGWADPILFEHRGKTWLFFEEIPEVSRKGRLMVMESFGKLGFGEPRVVLEKPYHLSYPFVFEWENDIYMIPESGNNRSVDVYRAQNFPDGWKHHTTLFSNVRVVDSTLFEQDGRWWLFMNIAQPRASSWEELHLFYADSPLGPYTAHPGNPIVSNAAFARPAGRLIRHEGRILRPAQDCSRRYGEAVVFNEITELSPTRYAERFYARLEPSGLPRAFALHSFAATKSMAVVDAERWAPRYWACDDPQR